MILNTNDLKDSCNKILSAVDASNVSIVTETLELSTQNNFLYMYVTNREYFVEVRIPISTNENFHATVNATLFLKFIAQTTTDTIELSTSSNCMIVKANGTYKFPLIFNGDELLSLPKIDVENVTTEFDVSGEILNSILTYNSKEIQNSSALKIAKPVQKMYYVDEKGAITFTTGACVNNFTLPEPISILLNPKTVKLFRLFKNDMVHFSLGHKQISDDIIHTRVKFESNDVVLSVILMSDDKFVSSVPVKAIRDRAFATYPYSIVVDKNDLLQAINRLLLFVNSADSSKPFGIFEFNDSSFTISDSKKENGENVSYCNGIDIDNGYTMWLDLVDLKSTLDNCAEQNVNISFGDGKAIVVTRGNIYNVIPEVKQV